MPKMNDILREKTHKGDLDTIHERVFYTLTDQKGLETVRLAKTISLLIEFLHDKNALNDKELDDLLLEVVS